MSLEENFRQLKSRLQDLQASLCPPDPEWLERCESELRDVIRLLADCAGNRRSSQDSIGDSERAALRQLKQAIYRLRAQLEHGLNLCQGWAQLHLSTGYTDQGCPILACGEPNTSYDA
jgi:hypothetical protein